MDLDEIGRILFPIKTLKDNILYLYKYYLDKYGYKYDSLIKKRVSNIVYILDSSPDITYNFLKANPTISVSEEYFDYIKRMANNYEKLNKELDKQMLASTILLFNKYHNITDIFTYDVHKILYLIVYMCNDRKRYIDEAVNLDITPINDDIKLEQFLHENEQILYNKEVKLLNDSLWGQNIKKNLNQKGLYFDDITFASLLNVSENGLFRSFEVNFTDIGFQPVIIIPILKRYCEGMNIDRIFLHEFRHAIENEGINRIGLQDRSSMLSCFNEVRTEGNAINDENNLRTIFSRRLLKGQKYFAEEVYYRNKGFFDSYNQILDDLAINNDIESLFKIFGKKEIIEYNDLLDNIMEKYLSSTSDISYDYEMCSKKIKVLEKNAMNNMDN